MNKNKLQEIILLNLIWLILRTFQLLKNKSLRKLIILILLEIMKIKKAQVGIQELEQNH